MDENNSEITEISQENNQNQVIPPEATIADLPDHLKGKITQDQLDAVKKMEQDIAAQDAITSSEKVDQEKSPTKSSDGFLKTQIDAIKGFFSKPENVKLAMIDAAYVATIAGMLWSGRFAEPQSGEAVRMMITTIASGGAMLGLNNQAAINAIAEQDNKLSGPKV